MSPRVFALLFVSSSCASLSVAAMDRSDASIEDRILERLKQASLEVQTFTSMQLDLYPTDDCWRVVDLGNPAVPALCRILDDNSKDDAIRGYASICLSLIDPPTARAKITDLLNKTAKQSTRSGTHTFLLGPLRASLRYIGPLSSDESGLEVSDPVPLSTVKLLEVARSLSERGSLQEVEEFASKLVDARDALPSLAIKKALSILVPRAFRVLREKFCAEKTIAGRALIGGSLPKWAKPDCEGRVRGVVRGVGP